MTIAGASCLGEARPGEVSSLSKMVIAPNKPKTKRITSKNASNEIVKFFMMWIFVLVDIGLPGR